MAGLLLGSLIKYVRMLQNVVAHIALYAVDVHALIIVAAVALLLAGVGADAGGDHGDGVGFHKDLRRALRIALSQLLHVAGNVGVCRTLDGTGGEMGLHASENGVVAVVALYGVALLAALSHTV